MLFHLGLATVSIVVLITFAIGWREGLVVLIVIPATILLTLFASWLMGYTINRVSLFALIFSIGILVDDAIVIVENIARHWAMNDGRNRTGAAIAAVAEVGNPTIVATLTIVAALLPMMFVSGLMGPYMSPIPANASIAMLFSFFIAVTVTPWLLLRFARKKVVAAGTQRMGFTPSGRWAASMLRSRGRCSRAASGRRSFCSPSAPPRSPPARSSTPRRCASNCCPSTTSRRSRSCSTCRMAPRLEDTDRMLMTAAERLKTLPELVSIQAYSGTASPFNFNGLVRHYYLRENPEQGDLSINLLPKGERSRASHAIALDIRHRLADLPLPDGSALKVVEVPPGPPVLATLLAEVYGPDAETRRATAAKIRKAFESVDFIVDVDDSYGKPSDRLRFSIDQEALEFHGVEEQAVYDTIGALVGGVKVGFSQRGGGTKPIDISVKLPKSAMTLDERLLSTPLPAGGTVRQGTNVELGDVVKVTRERASYPIFRHNGRFAEMVSGDVAGRFEAPIYGMLAVQDALAKMDWGPGGPPQIKYHGQPLDESHSTLLWDGEWEVTYVTFRDMGAAFMVAILGIYLLVVAQFGSFLLPLVILVPVPLDPDRHRARPLAARRGIHGDLDDRLHRARRHHRAQFDPAGGLHPPSPRGRRRFAAGGARRGRRDAVQADRADGGRSDDRRGLHPDRSNLPGPRHLARLRACFIDGANRSGDPGDLCVAERRRVDAAESITTSFTAIVVLRRVRAK